MKNFWQKSVLLLEIIFILVALIASISYFSSLNNPKSDLKAVSPTPSPTPEQTLVPEKTPASTPTSTPEPEPQPIYANLVSAGDCVLHKAFQQSALTDNGQAYDFTSVFEAIKPYTDSSDFSLISFESAATNNRKDYTGYPMFNCPPEIFDAFDKVGLDLVNNSNNHQLDRKVKGMLETRDNIEKAGLEVLGVYEGEETRYLIKDLNGIKVGLMAYTYSCNMNEKALSTEDQIRHLALIDEARMKKEITEMEAKGDITVVAMHWGTEYTQTPTDYQKKLARDMISWGADVILGSHPHVVQPSEIIEYQGEAKYVIYSMGNFVSNQRRGASGYPNTHKELCEDSMLVHLTFMKDPVTQKTVIETVDHIPTWLWRYPENGGYQFRVVPLPSPDYYQKGEYSKEVLAEANDSYQRTMRLVTDYKRP